MNPVSLLRPVVVAPQAAGRLLLSAMPGRRASLAEFQVALQAADIRLVLSLTGPAEIAAKSPDYAAALAAGGLPGRWAGLAIPDFGVPEDLAAFATFIAGGAMALQAGQAVLLHCAAGIGRTGTAALCLLHHLGLPAEQAEARILAAGSHPETEAQWQFVRRFRAAQSPGRSPVA